MTDLQVQQMHTLQFNEVPSSEPCYTLPILYSIALAGTAVIVLVACLIRQCCYALCVLCCAHMRSAQALLTAYTLRPFFKPAFYFCCFVLIGLLYLVTSMDYIPTAAKALVREGAISSCFQPNIGCHYYCCYDHHHDCYCYYYYYCSYDD